MSKSAKNRPAAAKRPPSPTPKPAVEGPAPAAPAAEEAVSARLANRAGVGQMPTHLQRKYVQRVGRLQGNRRASQVVATIQRHPGHDKPEESDFPPLQLAPYPGESVMRAEMAPEATTLATVNGPAAPLNVYDSQFGSIFGTGVIGQLPAAMQVRILSRHLFETRIHIETGPLAGRTGFVVNGSLTDSAAPTSQRQPTAGPENAYAQLQTALGAAPPVRNVILFIIQTRLTMDQHQRLLAAGNPEMVTMMGMAALTANDIIHILSVCGARLQRKLTGYLAKGGNTVAELRLALATADGEERMEVARNDALVGQLRPLLRSTHPEIIFGTMLSEVYPADGKIATLRTTNPNLARWLQDAGASGNLLTAAAAREHTIQDALTEMNTSGNAAAVTRVRSALQAAPRGAALGEAERTALDSIEERAYPEAAYTTNDLAVMFLTRMGRPFRNASAQPKTFLHRLYMALKRIPADHVVLNNVLEFFNVNTDPAAAGSFTDYLSSGNFGQLLSDAPRPEILHAAGAVNNSTSVVVVEPSLDLLGPNHQVTVEMADGTTPNRRVVAKNVGQRRLRLNQRVTMNAGASLRPPEASAFRSGAAMQITAATPFYANNAGAPNLANVLGTIAPGNLFSNMRTVTVGANNYIGGAVHAGPMAGQFGWIQAPAATAMEGNLTLGQAEFEWTARHEMGHSLDLQLNGYSRFSGPSAAQWRKYTGVDDWLVDLIATAPVANADTVQTFPPPPAPGGAAMSFRQAARTYANAVQQGTAAAAPALQAQAWLQGWVAAGGSQNVYNVITQFNANTGYFRTNNLGLPALGGRVFGAHYNEYFSANSAARNDSLAAGVPPYAYTCTYEFFADHYAAYTLPGTGGARFARAVPDWAKNFFDRLVGETGAGPRVGLERRRMAA
jgi:hypothetical protein